MSIPPEKDIEIVEQTDDWMIVVKPSGMLSTPGYLAKDNRETLMKRLRNQTGKWVFPIHRLDRGTSGLILFAKHQDAARSLAKLFETRRIDKSYLAIARGYVSDCEIDQPLAEDKSRPLQEAKTRLNVIDTIELPNAVGRYQTARYSLVEATPLTGRMHQIRRHFVHIRHPIVGDKVYGDRYHNRFMANQFKQDRLLLFATKLAFVDPGKGEKISVSYDADAFAVWRDLVGYDLGASCQ